VNPTIKAPCLCGHPYKQHNQMNKKAWDRFHKQLNGYVDSEEERLKFWKQFISVHIADEWRCTECDCEAFKMDNLRYLEEKANEKAK
jgi:hypothetical protein